MASDPIKRTGSRLKMLRTLRAIDRNLRAKCETTDDPLLRSIYKTLITKYPEKAKHLRRDILVDEFIVD